jgi:hypothetical protein
MQTYAQSAHGRTEAVLLQFVLQKDALPRDSRTTKSPHTPAGPDFPAKFSRTRKRNFACILHPFVATPKSMDEHLLFAPSQPRSSTVAGGASGASPKITTGAIPCNTHFATVQPAPPRILESPRIFWRAAQWRVLLAATYKSR